MILLFSFSVHNCGPPPSPSANMTHSFTTTQYLSVTTYTCELGYHYVTELSWRDGDDDLTRRSVCDDVWSVVDDECQCEFVRQFTTKLLDSSSN